MYKVSVIVCTHNPRKVILQRVLDGLRSQSLPLNEWELVLVDNASQVPVTDQFELLWHPNARHIREENIGLTPARLRGINESTSDILIFVDDDNVLASDYLEQTLFISEQWPFIGAWGGSIIPEYEHALPTWMGDQVWRLNVEEIKEDIWSNLREGFATIPCGAGLSFRRAVGLAYYKRCELRRDAAGFDRKGKSLTGYGDIDLSFCAIDLGMGTGKSTRLKLTHLISADRLTLDYLVRHAEGDAASWVLFRASRGLPIAKPNPMTLLSKLRWFFHRVTNRIPRELFEIQKAHHRGIQKGIRMLAKT